MDYELIAAYLAGECSETEKRAVEHWRKASDENEQEFVRYLLLWEASQANHKDYEPDMQQAWARLNPDPVVLGESQSPWKRLTWFRRVAAVLLMGFMLATGVYTYRLFQKPTVAWLENRTLPGEQSRLRLADGTVVWLNSASKLRYPKAFASQQREVFLEGEAFFEVARDIDKPFLIHSQQSVTQVLGTSFSVRSYGQEDSVAVVVVTGKVSFSSPQTRQSVMLTPGEQGILRKKRLQEQPNQDPNFLSWKTKVLTFQNTPLHQVLPALEHYFKIRISVANPELRYCRFTGVFQQPTLEEILKIFAIGKHITYQQEGNHYLLSGKGCQ